MSEERRPKRRIAAYFGRLVFSAGLAATAAIGVAIIAIEYRHGRGQIEEHLAIVRDSHVPAIAESFHSGDRAAIDSQLGKIVQVPHMNFAEARGASGLTVVAGERSGGKAVTRAFPLKVFRDGRDIVLGELVVTAGYGELFAHMTKTVLVVVPASAAWIFLLAALVFQLVQRRIARPLEALAGHARDFKQDDLFVPLRLPGRGDSSRGDGPPDEIDELETALNAMRLRLRAAHMEAQFRADALEIAVQERTKYLEASERRLRDAQTVARIGNWERNLVTGEGYWSDELCRIYGYEPGTNRTLDNFLAIVHPDDRENYRAMYVESVAGRGAFAMDVRIIRPDGRLRWIHTQAVVERDAAGRATRLIGTAQDITERVALEEARDDAEVFAQRAVEYLADALIVIGLDGGIRRVNPAAERMFGYAAAEMIGANVNILMPEPHKSAHDGYLSRYRQTGQANIIGQGRELTARRKNGTLFPVDLTVAEIMGSRERLFIGTLRDLTERRQAEQQLIVASQKAEVANRAKSDFLAIMGHELRTPLNAVLGYADLMRMQAFGPIGSPRYAEYLDIIHASGGHLLELINDILDVSAIEAGKVALREETLDAQQLCRDALRLVAPRADKGKVRVENRCPGGLPQFTADERRMKQILLNLLANAVKFTDAGGSATVAARLGSDRAMTFIVSDTGVGMSEAEAARALEPFGQADTGLSRKYEGSGLGLPLTKGLVELHGGTLTIDSAPGRGTVVTVCLPPERTRTAIAPEARPI